MVLAQTWAPTLNLVDVLNIIRQVRSICHPLCSVPDFPVLISFITQMMREPSAASPLEPEIARQLDENNAAFRETAAKWTADYAS